MGLPRFHSGKRISLPMQEIQWMQVWSLGQEDPLEEGMATHSSILAWKISWTEEPDGLQGSQRVRHHWTTENIHTVIILSHMVWLSCVQPKVHYPGLLWWSSGWEPTFQCRGSPALVSWSSPGQRLGSHMPQAAKSVYCNKRACLQLRCDAAK